MVRVTIELVPQGDETRKRLVAIGEIANDISGDDESGNYQAWFSKFSPKTHEVWKYGDVKGFPRLRLGHWDLVYRALKAAVGARNE